MEEMLPDCTFYTFRKVLKDLKLHATD